MVITEAWEGLRRDGRAVDRVIAALAAKVGNRLVTSQAVREQHGNTLTWIANQPPDAVVFPQSTEEVQEIVRLCADERVPVIGFGTGTSLEGQVNAPRGGICLDFHDMNSVIAVHAEDLDCVVQPGITRKQLNEHLRDQGVFFPIDPGADASLGGMAATRASGTNAVRYGTMKDVVLSLGVGAADGSSLRTGTRAKKSSAGYDLTHMFIGSEGTLGIIVEVALKLSGIPEAIAAGHCSFPSIRAACETTSDTIQSGLPIARIELIDTLSVRAFNNYSHTSLPEQPLLLVEFHGTEQSVAEQASRFAEIAAGHGGGRVASATKPEDRTKLWQARHDTYWSQLTLRPGARPFATDACVPISRLADCVEETLDDIKRNGLIAPIVGHVGDGNFHVTPLIDLDNKTEIEAADAFAHRLAHRAIAMGGTCTGEHGVGQKKREYMEEEHGAIAIDLMRRVKASFDPQNLFNPGKVFYA